MNKLTFLMITALVILTGCKKDEIAVGDAGQYGSIIASIEEGKTKSRLVVEQDNALKWSEGDVIRVYMKDDVQPSYYDYKYTSYDLFVPVDQPIPNGTTNEEVIGVFYGGQGDEGPLDSSVSGSTLETALAQNTSFIRSPENSIMLPMWGSWNDGHISFKHLAGILRVDLTDLPVGYDMLSVIASEPIANTFIVEDVTVSEPVLEVKEMGENLVNIKFIATTNNDRDKTLYVPLPVDTYESVQVLVSKYDENLSEGKFKEPVYLATWKNKTVERATIYTAAVAYKEVLNVSELNTALKSINEANKNAHLIVSDKIDDSQMVTIPEVMNSNITLDFNSVSGNASLEINSGDGTSAASTQNIAINVGNENSETAELKINTPTATVELGTGHFSEITATTATNTLIINGGVTIDKLTILGGNVLIEVGVQINQISNQGGGTITWVIKTEAGLKEAFEKGGKYMVYNDIAVTDENGINVGSGKTVILNLNNQTITAEGDGFVVEANETLTLNGNGFVKAGNSTGSWVAVWANGGTVTINDGNYFVGLDSDDSNSCIYAKNGGQITINGGTYSHEIPLSGNNYGMPLQVNNDTQGLITVNGGIFVLDNGRYYEQQDINAGKIVITAGETVDNGKVIVSGAVGNKIIIENQQLSDALYTLYGDRYYITLNSNGYAEMKESEVLAITQLNFDPYESEYQGSITTLDGIEHFVNLEDLECRISSLVKCDFSKNVKLQSVAIQHTKALTSLDFSNNPEIRALFLNYNEGLTSLNLTGCTQLGNLQLFGSGLTSLDIPNKTAMYNLLFGGSLRLNPADFPNLSGLGCENMGLTDLDNFIPVNIKSQLQSLYFDNNQVNTLDLSKYPKLQILQCGNNNIQKLDLSNVPNLFNLSCYGNKIETLDISAHEGLNDLNCGNQQDNINLNLELTLNQKSILVDNNAYFDPDNENVSLEIVVKDEAELKSAVEAGYNVKLGDSFTISSAVVVAKTLTIDMNGKTLTSNGDGFEVTSGILTIEGNGFVNAGTKGDSWVAVWANGGNVVIENGTFSVVEGKDGSTNDCIYAKGGQITINDGTFSNVGTYIANMGGVVINANNTVVNSQVIINGGTFKPATNCVAYEQKDVDEGRIILKNNQQN